MRLFIFEQITALGLGRDPESPEHSLFLEGRAMLSAIIADFAAVPGVELITFPTDTSANFATIFSQLASSADWTLLIAPESGGELLRLGRLVRESGGQLLGPSITGINCTADKQALARLWQDAGVPSPHTYEPGEAIHFPVVCKPRDGCGSVAVQLIHNPKELDALRPDSNRLIQEYVSGRATSISFLIGPNQTVPLLPTFQHLSDDGRFQYLGGETPIPEDLAERAISLGRLAIARVPGLFGYVGVDLVLGERDVAVEVNPRLTTSYVGLRALAKTNLALAMLDVCQGRPVELLWKRGPVKFVADGRVEWPTLPDSPPTPR